MSAIKILLVNQVRLVHSELVKMLTIRSTKVGLGGLIILPPTFAAAAVGFKSDDKFMAESQALDALSSSMLPMAIIFGFLSIMTFSSEKEFGFIHLTRLAAPRHLSVFTAKALSFVLLCLPAAALGFSIALLITRSGFDSSWQIFSGSQIKIIFNGAFALTCIGLVGLSIGSLAPSLFSALSTFGFVFAVLPPALALISGASARVITSVTLISALQASTTFAPGRAFTLEGVPPSNLDSYGGMWVGACWALLAIILALRLGFKTGAFQRSSKLRSPEFKINTRFIFANKLKPNTVARIALANLIRYFTTRHIVLLAFSMMIISIFLTWTAAPTYISHLQSEARYFAWEVDEVQNQVLKSGFQLMQIFFVSLGSLMYFADSGPKVRASALVTSPKRGKYWTAQLISVFFSTFTLAVIMFICISIACLIQFGNASIASNVFSEASLFTLCLSSFAFGLCAVIGLGVSSLLDHLVISVAVNLAIFLILPSIVVISSISVQGQIALNIYNAYAIFPSVSSATLWLSPNTLMSNSLASGQIQVLPAQALAVITAWAILMALLPTYRVLTRPS